MEEESASYEEESATEQAGGNTAVAIASACDAVDAAVLGSPPVVPAVPASASSVSAPSAPEPLGSLPAPLPGDLSEDVDVAVVGEFVRTVAAAVVVDEVVVVVDVGVGVVFIMITGVGAATGVLVLIFTPVVVE